MFHFVASLEIMPFSRSFLMLFSIAVSDIKRAFAISTIVTSKEEAH